MRNKWIIWGAKTHYNTFGHFFAAFERALKYLGREVYWLDAGTDRTGIDLSDSVFISQNRLIKGMPVRKDCWYVIQNGNDPWCKQLFAGHKILVTGLHQSEHQYPDPVCLGPDIYFVPEWKTLHFRHNALILPHEIEANKPGCVFNSESRVINYFATVDASNCEEVYAFRRACIENGITFNHYGGAGFTGLPGKETLEEKIQGIKDSYMAPTIQGQNQIEVGNTTDRVVNNIAYGQYPVTNNPHIDRLFGGIYNTNTYELFYEAQRELPYIPVRELHYLMDEVALNWTYLNTIDGIERALDIMERT